MKKTILIATAAIIVLSLQTCSSLADGMVSGALGALGNGLSRSDAAPADSGSSTSAPAAQAEFKSGEILCSDDSGSMFNASFFLARVLTPASAATKNQAEVIWISDGSKAWVNHIVDSRKATGADMQVGAAVLYMPGWAEHDPIPADAYRKETWALGRVTDTSDMFKNLVEVNGNKYYIASLRVPVGAVK